MNETTETVPTPDKPAPTNLYIALHKARAAMGMVGKGGFNTYDKYTYSTLADYLQAIQKPLDENGLLVVSDIDTITWLPDRDTRGGGKEKVCQIMLRTTVIHAASGESMSVKVLGEGQDRGDKAFYKADTGARKYALANLFNLATDDDPETDSPETVPPRQPAPPVQKRESQPQPPAKPSGAPPTQDAAPKSDMAEIARHQVQMKGWQLDKILDLANAAETVENLEFVIDGAEDGDAWYELDQRAKLFGVVRERYKAIISKAPAKKRDGAAEDRFKQKMLAHKTKLELDQGFEEMNQKMEKEEQQHKANEAQGTT